MFYDDVCLFLTQRYPLTRSLGPIVLRLPHDILQQAHAGRVLRTSGELYHIFMFIPLRRYTHSLTHVY